MKEELKQLIMGVCLVLFMLVTALAITSCDDPAVTEPTQVQEHRPHHREPSRQERILIQQGYTNIRMTGTPFFGCSKDDSFFASSNFTATAPTGDDVEGTVCCGLMFKGCTVRW